MKTSQKDSPFNERVYRLVEVPPAIPPKQRRYRSIYAEQARVLYNSNRNESASMGLAKVPLRPTKEFLRKHENETILAERKTFFHYQF
jgi:hypothetical protein